MLKLLEYLAAGWFIIVLGFCVYVVLEILFKGK
jgi:hypothetical protein